MCDEKIMKKWFEKQPQDFLRCYWNYLIKRAYLIRTIFGTNLQEIDFRRLYNQSVFYKWGLIVFDEFLEILYFKLKVSEGKKLNGGRCA